MHTEPHSTSMKPVARGWEKNEHRNETGLEKGSGGVDPEIRLTEGVALQGLA